MALSYTWTSLADAAKQSSASSWLPTAVSTPASVTWTEVKSSGSFYTAKDSASQHVIHVAQSSPTSVDIALKEDGGHRAMLGSATGENFEPLRAHLAGLV